MKREQESLLQVFRIGYDDLNVNRLGKLSIAQQGKLLSEARRSLPLTILFSSLFTILIYSIFYYSMPQLYFWIIGLLLFIAQFVVCMLSGISYIRQTQAAVENGLVVSFLGQIELSKSSEDGGGWWFTTLDRQFFQLPSLFHPWHAYKHGTYRAYIVPGIRKIVAIETMYKDF